MHDRYDAIVIGGGIIGLAVALELSRRGQQVTVIDKGEPFHEASRAGAGMLGAHVEIHQDGPFFELCRMSQRMYRSWTDKLFEQTGISPQYRSEGLLRVALDEEDEQELKGRLSWIGDYEWLSSREVRELEPEVSEHVRGGLFFKEDHQIHPIPLSHALEAALRQSGCRILSWTSAYRLLTEKGSVTGVLTSQGELYADLTIVAAGSWSGQLLSEAGVQINMMPVKGQCMAVRPQQPIIRRTLFTSGSYLIPRNDGTVTIGATQEEAGFDKTATAGAIALLQSRASRLIPSINDAGFVKTWCGLRPGTRDGLPYIGAVNGLQGLLLATGHFRNGILLAPVTAAIIGQLSAGEPTLVDLTPYRPERTAVLHG